MLGFKFFTKLHNYTKKNNKNLGLKGYTSFIFWSKNSICSLKKKKGEVEPCKTRDLKVKSPQRTMRNFNTMLPF